jgi:hypothetical protein
VELTWQEKLEKIDKSGLIEIGIYGVYDLTIANLLTEDEYKRLVPKLDMVRELAQKLALNMVKGTLKYNTDDWSMAEWFAFGIDDAADSLNYWLLTRNKYAKGCDVPCCQV